MESDSHIFPERDNEINVMNDVFINRITHIAPYRCSYNLSGGKSGDTFPFKANASEIIRNREVPKPHTRLYAPIPVVALDYETYRAFVHWQVNYGHSSMHADGKNTKTVTKHTDSAAKNAAIERPPLLQGECVMSSNPPTGMNQGYTDKNDLGSTSPPQAQRFMPNKSSTNTDGGGADNRHAECLNPPPLQDNSHMPNRPPTITANVYVDSEYPGSVSPPLPQAQRFIPNRSPTLIDSEHADKMHPVSVSPPLLQSQHFMPNRSPTNIDSERADNRRVECPPLPQDSSFMPNRPSSITENGHADNGYPGSVSPPLLQAQRFMSNRSPTNIDRERAENRSVECPPPPQDCSFMPNGPSSITANGHADNVYPGSVSPPSQVKRFMANRSPTITDRELTDNRYPGSVSPPFQQAQRIIPRRSTNNMDGDRADSRHVECPPPLEDSSFMPNRTSIITPNVHAANDYPVPVSPPLSQAQRFMPIRSPAIIDSEHADNRIPGYESPPVPQARQLMTNRSPNITDGEHVVNRFPGYLSPSILQNQRFMPNRSPTIMEIRHADDSHIECESLPPMQDHRFMPNRPLNAMHNRNAGNNSNEFVSNSFQQAQHLTPTRPSTVVDNNDADNRYPGTLYSPLLQAQRLMSNRTRTTIDSGHAANRHAACVSSPLPQDHSFIQNRASTNSANGHADNRYPGTLSPPLPQAQRFMSNNPPNISENGFADDTHIESVYPPLPQDRSFMPKRSVKDKRCADNGYTGPAKECKTCASPASYNRARQYSEAHREFHEVNVTSKALANQGNNINIPNVSNDGCCFDKANTFGKETTKPNTIPNTNNQPGLDYRNQLKSSFIPNEQALDPSIYRSVNPSIELSANYNFDGQRPSLSSDRLFAEELTTKLNNSIQNLQNLNDLNTLETISPENANSVNAYMTLKDFSKPRNDNYTRFQEYSMGSTAQEYKGTHVYDSPQFSDFPSIKPDEFSDPYHIDSEARNMRDIHLLFPRTVVRREPAKCLNPIYGVIDIEDIRKAIWQELANITLNNPELIEKIIANPQGIPSNQHGISKVDQVTQTEFSHQLGEGFVKQLESPQQDSTNQPVAYEKPVIQPEPNPESKTNDPTETVEQQVPNQTNSKKTLKPTVTSKKTPKPPLASNPYLENLYIRSTKNYDAWKPTIDPAKIMELYDGASENLKFLLDSSQRQQQAENMQRELQQRNQANSKRATRCKRKTKRNKEAIIGNILPSD